MEGYFGVAEEVGLSKEEMGSVQAIVMAVSAGRVGAQFRHATRNAQPIGSNGSQETQERRKRTQRD